MTADGLPQHDAPGDATEAPRGRASSPTQAMMRCAACDAPNVTDRDTCWRCLRRLGEEAEGRDVPEATIGISARARPPITIAAWPREGTAPRPAAVGSVRPSRPVAPVRRRRRPSLAAVSAAALLVVAVVGAVSLYLATAGLDRGSDPIGTPLLAAAADPSDATAGDATVAPAVAPAVAEPTSVSGSEVERAATTEVEAIDPAEVASGEAPPDEARRARAAGTFTCGEAAEPIRDLGGRTWRVTKVSFRAMSGFERVILHLERIGDARPGQETVAIAARVPRSELSELPRDIQPDRTRRGLLRIEMPGVPDAPELRAFRPIGLGLVGQLSLMSGRGSRTALLAIDRDACYRVRVPAWSASGDTDTRRAEVVIDIRD